ncbi:MAG: GDSL-type esterase/lipase family protein [Lachnospiraceae bacterium]
MRKKQKKGFLWILLCLLCMTMPGCGAAKDPFADCEYLTREMYERAITYNNENTDESRIADVMRRAKAGEEITIGVIGGSITQGSSASTQDKCYASLLKKWWEEKFPDATIHFVNAGIGGTSSYYGVHRVEKDLLRYEPDLVVVEFSVNDGNDQFYKKSYDNLVYRILSSEKEPAVMLLFMTMDNGTSAQDNDALVGFHYKIPMLSYKNAVMPEIEAGNFTWKDISPDNIHPNDRGHAIIGEMFSVYLNDVYNRLGKLPKEKEEFKQSILTKPVYQEATILYTDQFLPDADDQFAAGEDVTFTVEGQRIGILYGKFVNGYGGQMDVYVDGKLVKTLNADFSGGWGNYDECEEVFAGEGGSHSVEFRWNENTTGLTFHVTGVLVAK